jgi:hypothetical protein
MQPRRKAGFTHRARVDKGRGKDFIKKRLERDAARKAKQREKETPASAKKRLEQRIRASELRQRKWEDE